MQRSLVGSEMCIRDSSCAPETSVQKVKMLTQDGVLVEVDMSKVKGSKQKISNKELQSWVKKEI